MSSQKTEFTPIAPVFAQHILAKNNIDNRYMRPSHVEAMAKQMSEGKWVTTHQGIAFDTTGRLIDGQHRLAAIVMSGVTVVMAVTHNVDPDAYKVIDHGVKRTAADRCMLTDDVATNRHVIALLLAYHRHAKRERQSPPTADLEATFEQCRGSWLWAGRTFPERTRDGLMRASVKAAAVTMHHRYPLQAEQFAQGLITAEGLYAGDPVHTLRKALPAINPSSPDNYWKAIAAMRAYVEKRRLTYLVPGLVDFVQNANTDDVIAARQAKAYRISETRKRNQGGAA